MVITTQEEMQDNKNTVIQPGGLSTDTSLVNQPQNMTRFVLNGVNETIDGDRGFIANEESNEPCYLIPSGFTPIGKVYIGNEETVIFLCSPAGNSMIVVVDRECNLSIHVDDTNQTEKLGFKVNKQIDATYRLRRGCERTIYWVDPIPRTFIIERPEKYQDSLGDWDISKFDLFKKYQSIPNVDSIEVINGGGNLASGSYNFAVQYLDEDLNPTEFTMSTETVEVYNSDFTLPYREVRGSTNTVTPYQNFGVSDKSIRIVLSNLDNTFPFYRLAITEATSATGQVSDTKYTAEISTLNTVFTYTGSNYESIGITSEVLLFNSIIEEADTIEQLENRLLLGNVKGKDVNLCNLQKYASRITVDMITRKISLNSLVPENPKHPSFHFDGIGYMPGEIYSLGIIYIFDDNTLTPVFHIPGKSNTLSAATTFTTGVGIYPMALNNTSSDNRYIDNESCTGINYWGVDSEGIPLSNQLVRHHRLPLRTEVGLPFVELLDSASTENAFKRIQANIQGTISTPVVCEEGDVGCIPVVANLFQYQITYHKDADLTDFVFTGQVNPADYTNPDDTYDINENDLSNSILATTITFISIDESQEDGTIIRLNATILLGVLTANSATGDKLNPDGTPSGVIVPGRNLDYTISLSTEVIETTESAYVADIFGLQFSNIELPAEAELNGNKIIGYYIVRNERTEDEKTILDSAVLFSTTQHENFVSSGLLMPENDPVDKNIKKDILSIINPEFKFNNKKYRNFNSIVQQGRFTRTEAIHSRTKIIDVQDGNSYQDRHKDAENSRFQGNGENGADGFMLQIKTRDNILNFTNENDFEFTDADIKEIFYLPALGDKLITDSADIGVDVFNLACDNQIGILSLKEEVTFPITNSIPYVYFTKDNANSYNNFRLTPYYKDSQNPVYFGNDTISTTSVFNGDSYIAPLRYTNSIFHDNRLRLRAGKTSAWNYVGAAILVIAAVAIAIFTLGAGTGVSTILVTLAAGVASAAVGMAATLVASGIKQDTWTRTYKELYNKGLRETIQDDYVLYDSDDGSYNTERGFSKNPPDDEIQWLGETLNLWFESTVNMNWRQGASDNTPDFLNAPGLRQDGVNYPESDEEYFGIHSVRSREIPATTALDLHMVRKLTYLDDKRKGGRSYFGLAAAEVYQLNLDYTRRNKEKIFNHLPLEYDCCSDCNETFPHRYHYSEQSFQEELTDNFRTFLPNNYRDIEGETGVITDMFRIQNNLYIHTEEALWNQPQNFQERVTNQVVSFIGTGDYFSIPPRKIVDDNNSSAGNTHKWARIKTRFGVLFPSHKEKKWYIFNGTNLQPITDNFNSNYFRENMNFEIVNDYYQSNKLNYPYINNPSNSIGVGYLSTYDTKKERLIVSKKDFIISNLPPDNYQICNENGVIMFGNIAQMIEDESIDGWNYIGIEGCQLKFQRATIETRTEIRYEEISIFKDIDYLVFKYNFNGTTGGTDLDTRTKLLVPSVQGPMGFAGVNIANPYLYWSGDNTGTGLESIYIDIKQIKIDFPSAPEVIFNAAAWWYVFNAEGGIMNMDAEAYTGGTMGLVGFLFTNTGGVLQGTYSFEDKFIPEAPTGGAGVPEGAANQIGDFTYNILTGDLSWDGASGGATPPDTIVMPIEVEVDYPVMEYKFVEGQPFIPEYVNNSWTMSYSLKDTKWISWHSYLPSFYLYVQEKFYSWKEGLNNIWRHGKENHYQTFYGEFSPFIIEYVDNSNAIVTKIYDAIKFQTEAKQYDVTNDSFTDKRYITFNKVIAYNTHQISGLMNMIVKSENIDYMSDQIVNEIDNIPIDRSERDWDINDLRDLSIDPNVSMFNKNLTDLQANYFIDKIINDDRIDYNKDWFEQESFRDKFLVVRLIFDTFDNTRLLMNFSIQDSKISER